MSLKIEGGLLVLITGTANEVAREIVLGRPVRESPEERSLALGLRANASPMKVLAAQCERLGLATGTSVEAVNRANYTALATQLGLHPDASRRDIIRADLSRLASIFGITSTQAAASEAGVNAAAVASCKQQLGLPQSATYQEVQLAGTQAGWYRAGRPQPSPAMAAS
jgi:hypothetical protein